MNLKTRKVESIYRSARLVAIDPGLGGTGWAEWTDSIAPSRCGVIVPSRDTNLTLTARSTEIGLRLRAVLCELGRIRSDMHVYIEIPQQMTHAAGLAAQRGSVYKLAYTAGVIAGHLYPAQVFDIEPGKWKGQLPKSVTIRRVTRTLGEQTVRSLGIKSHAFDAVGIGLWAMGKLT